MGKRPNAKAGTREGLGQDARRHARQHDALESALTRAVARVESRLLGPGGEAYCDRLDFNDVGIPWLLYDLTGNEEYAGLGRRVFDRLAENRGWTEQSENNGFRIYYSAVLGYKLTGDPRMHAEVMQGLKATERIFDPRAGVFRGDAWVKGVQSTLVDTGATLSPFLSAANEMPRYRQMLRSHFRRATCDHVRLDGSTFQMALIDPQTKETVGHRTYQGYAEDSCWARGQAWAIYGFAGAYEVLRLPLFLETAAKLADWYVEHLPDDCIPYYDFLDPHIPDAAKDTSAAALACAGLLRLCRHWADAPRKYEQVIRATMEALQREYLTPVDAHDSWPPGMLLGGCWGRFPDEFIRRNSAWIHPQNTHQGDYYVWKRNIVLPENGELFYTLGFFVEAMHRLLKPDSGLLDF